MKEASPALIALLSSTNQFIMADLYTVTREVRRQAHHPFLSLSLQLRLLPRVCRIV